MGSVSRFIVAFAVAGILTAALPTSALASPPESAQFGQMVAMCAHSHAGCQRANPPAVTCTCGPTCACTCSEGTMTFDNFGGMVHHMQDMACC